MPTKFYLYPRPNKQGEYPIRVSVSIKFQRLMTGIGYNVDKEAWGNGKVCKPQYKNSKGVTAKTINSRIAKIDAHFSEYELTIEKEPTLEELKHELQIVLGAIEESVVKPVNEKTLINNLDEFIREQSIDCSWAPGTLQCWNAFKAHISTFDRHVKYEFFNEDGMNKFIRFLRITQELEENTVRKQYNNLKWFLNWAIRKGYCKESQITKFRPRFKVTEKPVIFLTKEELLKVYNYQVPANGERVKLVNNDGKEYEKIVENSGALSKTRDLFCFCAFTSLRYSDMATLKRTDIIDDTIYVTSHKTHDRLPIILNKYAKDILGKYKGSSYYNDTALPVISNQKMNDYLKDLCELCEINTPITRVGYRKGQRYEETYPKYQLIGTHAGRRTFICFALSNGVPPQVVMKWTGHNDYKAMRPYIDIAEKTKADAMKKIEDAFGE